MPCYLPIYILASCCDSCRHGQNNVRELSLWVQSLMYQVYQNVGILLCNYIIVGHSNVMSTAAVWPTHGQHNLREPSLCMASGLMHRVYQSCRNKYNFYGASDNN